MGLPIPRPIPMPPPAMGGSPALGLFIVSSTDRIMQAASAAADSALILIIEGSQTHCSKLSEISSLVISTPYHWPPAKIKPLIFFLNSKFGYFKYSVFSVTSGHVVVHEPSTHISNKQLQLRTCWQLHRKVPAHKTKQEICTHSQLVRKSTHYGTTVGVRKSCQDKHALAEEERSYSTEQQFFLAVAYKIK